MLKYPSSEQVAFYGTVVAKEFEEFLKALSTNRGKFIDAMRSRYEDRGIDNLFTTRQMTLKDLINFIQGSGAIRPLREMEKLLIGDHDCTVQGEWSHRMHQIAEDALGIGIALLAIENELPFDEPAESPADEVVRERSFAGV